MPGAKKVPRRSTTKTRAQRDARMSVMGIASVVVIVFVVMVLALLTQARNSTAPAPLGTYDGIAQSITADGAPILGDPNAKIMVMEILDFSCSHCAEYHPLIQQFITDDVRTGKAQLLIRPVTFVGGSVSQVATSAALCAGKQNAFWPMYDQLFSIANSETPQAFTTTRLHDAAATLKLDTKTFDNCMSGSDSKNTISTDEQLANQLGVNSTPSVLYSLDGGKTFQWWIDPSQPDQHSHGGVPLGTIEDTVSKVYSS